VPLVWCDESDLVLYWDQTETVFNNLNDTAGFLLERGRVTANCFRDIVTRYMLQPGQDKTRHLVPDPIVGFDWHDSAYTAPTQTDVTTALNTPGGIVLEARLREIVARRSLAMIMKRQMVASGSSAYRQTAIDMMGAADEIFHCYRANIITAVPLGGGASQFLIGTNDCLILPPGTSP
jgi:hypothetical protein